MLAAGSKQQPPHTHALPRTSAKPSLTEAMLVQSGLLQQKRQGRTEHRAWPAASIAAGKLARASSDLGIFLLGLRIHSMEATTLE